MGRFLELFVAITSNWKNVLIAILVTICISYYSISFNNDLPKPETILEFGKYYFDNTGPYLFGMLLNFISSLFTIVLSFSFIHFSFSNTEEFHPLVLIIVGILGLAIFIVSFYFWRYFFLLLITLILIAIGGYVIFKALADSK